MTGRQFRIEINMLRASFPPLLSLALFLPPPTPNSLCVLPSFLLSPPAVAIYNSFDLLGRISTVMRWTQRISPGWLLVFSIVRVAFIPSFLVVVSLGMRHPGLAVYPLLFGLGLTNGYVSGLCSMVLLGPLICFSYSVSLYSFTCVVFESSRSIPCSLFSSFLSLLPLSLSIYLYLSLSLYFFPCNLIPLSIYLSF